MPTCPKCEHKWDEKEEKEEKKEKHESKHESAMTPLQEVVAENLATAKLYESCSVTLEGDSRIDREAGIIRHVHVLGTTSKHGYVYDEAALAEATPLFEGVIVGLDHNFKGEPLGVRETIGNLSNPSRDHAGIWADLHYLKSHAFTATLLESAEAILQKKQVGKVFGLSCENDYRPEKDLVRGRVMHFRPVRCDVVAGGGATTKSLLESNAAIPETDGTESKMLQEQVAALQSRLSDMEKRQQLFESVAAPRAGNEQIVNAVIAETGLSGEQLKSFWDKELNRK